MTGFASAMLLAAGKTVQLIDESIVVSVNSPANAGGTLSLSSAGIASGNGSFPFSYNWLLSSASYEVMATLQGSTTLTAAGDARGVWLALSSSRSWSYTRSIAGEATASLLIQIRPTGGSPIASCTVGFDCTVN